jgi:[ribosomal protein S18]-alanine N-acetyltransferase
MFHKVKMTKEYATEIANWQYNEPIALYSGDGSEETIQEYLDGTYYAVLDPHEQLFGFYCTGNNAQVPGAHGINVYQKHAIDVGVGMNPKNVGKGFGEAFLQYILTQIKKNEREIDIRLTVATFNYRAIHLYEQIGFTVEKLFKANEIEFQVMYKTAL